MPDRDQARALKLLSDALEVLRRMEDQFPVPWSSDAREEQARKLADEIDGFLNHRPEGTS